MTDDQKGKTALITGASSGLGRTLALDLARREMNLVLAARREDVLKEVAVQAKLLGAAVHVQAADVTDETQCRVMVDRTIEVFGRIDFLILSAGISMWARFDEISHPSIFEKLMKTNFLGAVHCIDPALPWLRQSGGTIVAISSAQAVVGMPNHTGYSASKHALKGFLEALESELDEAVHILNVMPGWIRGSNLRTSALKGDGAAMGRTRGHSSHSVSLEACSAEILRAMEKGTRELYIPSSLRLLPWLRLIAPKWLKASIKRAVERQEE